MKHMQLKLQPSTINFYKNHFVILATATYVRVDGSTVLQAWHCIYMSIVIREGTFKLCRICDHNDNNYTYVYMYVLLCTRH